MAEEHASNYDGTKPGGSAPIIPLGQTSGPYGNDPFVKARVPEKAKEIKNP